MINLEEIIPELLQKVDIVSIIGEDIVLSTTDNVVHYGKCPNCDEIFFINKDTQLFSCYGCGEGGNVINYLMDIKHMNYLDVVKFLLDETESEYSIEDVKNSLVENSYINTLNNLNKEAATFYYCTLRNKIGSEGMKYYKKRGLSNEIMKQFGLGFAPYGKTLLYNYLTSKGYTDEQLKSSSLVNFYEDGGIQDKFRNRVIVPIMNEHGKVVAFGGRMLKEKTKGDPTPKYLNSNETEVFDKGKTVFALNVSKSSKRNGFILCEGYMDVISMHQAGFDNAIASLGTALTEKHANLIKKYRDDVYLAYDSDGPGNEATKKNIKILQKAGLNLKVINMLPAKDPDEFIQKFGEQAFEDRITNALSPEEFMILYYKNKFDSAEDDEKPKIMNELCLFLKDL